MPAPEVPAELFKANISVNAWSVAIEDLYKVRVTQPPPRSSSPTTCRPAPNVSSISSPPEMRFFASTLVDVSPDGRFALVSPITRDESDLVVVTIAERSDSRGSSSFVQGDRQMPNALPRRVEHGVRHGRRRTSDADLADLACAKRACSSANVRVDQLALGVAELDRLRSGSHSGLQSGKVSRIPGRVIHSGDRWGVVAL